MRGRNLLPPAPGPERLWTPSLGETRVIRLIKTGKQRSIIWQSARQIDNGFLRVTRWEIAPGGAIPMHVHEYEYVVVPRVKGSMHVTEPNGSEIAAELQIGRSYARTAGTARTVANRGADPIIFVEIENLSKSDGEP
jgi:quercetin dioxygenase-like cupin family protein